MRRGFTLMELLLVLSMVSGIAAATGLLYLEVRIAGVVTESQVALERRAALVLERVARDIRGATRVDTSTPNQIRIARSDGDVVYRVEGKRVIRDYDGSSRTLAQHARRLTVRTVERGHRAEIELVRALVRGRKLALTRSAFVGVRR